MTKKKRQALSERLKEKQHFDSFPDDYWRYAVEYGVHYYIAGRFTVHAQFSFVPGALIHHAIELLLKACLAKKDKPEDVYTYHSTYGHKLDKLWSEFKLRNPSRSLSAYDTIVKQLDAFETIRYPEELVLNGARLDIGFGEYDPSLPEPELTGANHYRLLLPQIDRLIRVLFECSEYNPDILQLNEHSTPYLCSHNASPLKPCST